jgi:hypothetical protein
VHLLVLALHACIWRFHARVVIWPRIRATGTRKICGIHNTEALVEAAQAGFSPTDSGPRPSGAGTCKSFEILRSFASSASDEREEREGSALQAMKWLKPILKLNRIIMIKLNHLKISFYLTSGRVRWSLDARVAVLPTRDRMRAIKRSRAGSFVL